MGFVPVIALWVFSTPALAQDCSAILSHGIWEKSEVVKTAEQFNSFTSWLCSKSSNEVKQSYGLDLSTALPIGETLIPVGVGLSSDSWEAVQTQLCSYDTGTSWAKDSLQITATKASNAIVSAWQACVSAFGTKNWVELQNPERFVVRLSKRKEYVNDSDKISLQAVTLQSDTKVTCVPPLPEKPTTGISFTYNCKRDDATKDVVITTAVDGLLKDLPTLRIGKITPIPTFDSAGGTDHAVENQAITSAVVGPFADGHRWINITRLVGQAITWKDPQHTPWVSMAAKVGDRVLCSKYFEIKGGADSYITATVEPATCGAIFLPRNTTVTVVGVTGNWHANAAGAFLTLKYRDVPPLPQPK